MIKANRETKQIEKKEKSTGEHPVKKTCIF